MNLNKNIDWSKIHNERVSWRKKIIGDINEFFVIPRYVSLFYKYFNNDKNSTFFEIGSGVGDLSIAILKENKTQIGKYVTSEYFQEGVEWLKRIGLESILADATNLYNIKDEEYDVAIAFDVMHHVFSPEKMASEMMRISRGRCLLVESNGLSIFRKIKELTPGHRKAGEKSYTPWRYKKFFTKNKKFDIKKFEIFPFLFPFKCPSFFLPFLIKFNYFIEKVPFLKWQCSSVAIYLEFKKKNVTINNNE